MELQAGAINDVVGCEELMRNSSVRICAKRLDRGKYGNGNEKNTFVDRIFQQANAGEAENAKEVGGHGTYVHDCAVYVSEITSNGKRQPRAEEHYQTYGTNHVGCRSGGTNG